MVEGDVVEAVVVEAVVVEDVLEEVSVGHGHLHASGDAVAGGVVGGVSVVEAVAEAGLVQLGVVSGVVGRVSAGLGVVSVPEAALGAVGRVSAGLGVVSVTEAALARLARLLGVVVRVSVDESGVERAVAGAGLRVVEGEVSVAGGSLGVVELGVDGWAVGREVVGRGRRRRFLRSRPRRRRLFRTAPVFGGSSSSAEMRKSP